LQGLGIERVWHYKYKANAHVHKCETVLFSVQLIMFLGTQDMLSYLLEMIVNWLWLEPRTRMPGMPVDDTRDSEPLAIGYGLMKITSLGQ
jgi:hypothetical protein